MIHLPVFELKDGVKDEIVLLPYGEHVSEDGTVRFRFSRQDAPGVVAAFKARGIDFLFDYEHQSIAHLEPFKMFQAPDGRAPAAAWAKELAAGEKGLMARGIQWTPAAMTALKNGEYRYFSPVIVWGRGGEAGGQVVAVHCAALTNEPRLTNIPALAAKCDLGELYTPYGKDHSMITPEVAGALGLKTDATDQDLLSAITALKTQAAAGATAAGQVTAFKTTADKVPGLETKVAELTGQATATAAEIAGLKTQLTAFKGTLANAVLDFALDTGRITPAAKEAWKPLVEADPEKTLTAFKAMTPGTAVPTGRFNPQGGGDGGTEIQIPAGKDDHITACKGVDFDPEALKVHNAAIAYQKANANVDYADAVAAVRRK